MTETAEAAARREREAAERRSFATLFWEDFWFFAPPTGPLPEATPADGPDPYGNPDPEWLRIDWREHLRRADIGGAEVNYVEMGSGEGTDIVFVHGLSGSWQNFLENIPHFARNHRVLAMDLPGFGASPMPDWELSIENYGRWLHEFCAATGVSDCVVVGNSMGGFIAAEAAHRRLDGFSKLVLVSAAGVSHARARGEPAEMAARLAVAAAPIALRMHEAMLRRRRLRFAAFRNLFHDPLALRPELLFEFLHNGAGKPGFLPAIQHLFGYDILEELEKVEIPALIVWGRYDRVVTARDAETYARHLRNSRVEIFNRCGHIPQAERPVRFNRLLEEFLAE